MKLVVLLKSMKNLRSDIDVIRKHIIFFCTILDSREHLGVRIFKLVSKSMVLIVNQLTFFKSAKKLIQYLITNNSGPYIYFHLFLVLVWLDCARIVSILLQLKCGGLWEENCLSNNTGCSYITILTSLFFFHLDNVLFLPPINH